MLRGRLRGIQRPTNAKTAPTAWGLLLAAMETDTEVELQLTRMLARVTALGSGSKQVASAADRDIERKLDKIRSALFNTGRADSPDIDDIVKIYYALDKAGLLNAPTDSPASS